MSHADYASIPATNWSLLKELRRSPLHYRHRLTTPLADTARMAFGRAVHCAVLEPDRFPLEYIVWDGARRGKEWAAFKLASGHRTILTADEYRTCLAVRDSVRSDPVAAPYLQDGESEVTIQWTDDATGIKCKARLDYFSAAALVDVKTTADVTDRIFGALAARMGYHGQMAFYHDGLAANGCDVPVKIIAVEAEPPHDVAVFDVDEDALWAGRQLYRGLLAMLAGCLETERWPGRYQTEVPLALPAWVYPDMDDEMVLTGLVPAGGMK